MGWWLSVKDRASEAGSRALNSAKWFWDNASLSKISSTVFTFSTNTTFHVLEEALALRTAVPTLISNPKARRIVNGMSYLVVHDVLPLVSLNYVNNGVQKYFRDGYDENESSSVYSIFLSALSLGSFIVTAYTWQRGAQTFVRVAVLDSFGPPAFNSNRKGVPPSLCIDYDCNEQRKWKGMGRELGILLANEALISGISYIPYAGPPVAKALTVVNNGRYVTRVVTPERCERHKAMEQEFVVAIGLTFELMCWLMDKGLNATVGPLPFLYLRTLRHIVLAFQVNLAAHMEVPLANPEEATVSFDLFNYYERVWRFILDVFWAGLLKRVPIDFRPEQGVPPFIPLSTFFQVATRMLKSDLEKERLLPSNQLMRTMKDKLLPPMFRSTYDFTRDPVIADYWSEIREGAITTLEMVESYGRTRVVATMAHAPKGVAVLLDLQFGIPAKVTRIALMLSRERDFWDLFDAMKAWFERHNPKVEVRLVTASTTLPLRCTTTLAPLPAEPEKPRVISSAAALLSASKPVKKEENQIDLSQLVSVARPKEYVTVSEDAFFSTRPRRRPKQEPMKIELIDEENETLSF